MKTYVIGDIHGAYLALKELIDSLPLKAEDQLIFLGDYVDGWSQSTLVIDYLMDLNELYSCVFIKGNHDDYCEHWLRTNEAVEKWLIHGGEGTKNEYDLKSESYRKKHLDFFEKMLAYYINDNNELFIHAGFTSIHGPEKEVHFSNYYWDRTLWEMVIAMDKNLTPDDPRYPRRLKKFNAIYIGHTPTTRFFEEQPMQAHQVWNLDTGAGYKGRLSAMEVNSKQLWQSSYVYEWYPNENGRN